MNTSDLALAIEQMVETFKETGRKVTKPVRNVIIRDDKKQIGIELKVQIGTENFKITIEEV